MTARASIKEREIFPKVNSIIDSRIYISKICEFIFISTQSRKLNFTNEPSRNRERGKFHAEILAANSIIHRHHMSNRLCVRPIWVSFDTHSSRLLATHCVPSPSLGCMIYHEFNSAQLSTSTHQTVVAMVRLKWIWMTIELLSRLELLWVTKGRLHANNKRKLCAEKNVQGRERVKNCIIIKWLTHKVAQSRRGRRNAHSTLSQPHLNVISRAN